MRKSLTVGVGFIEKELITQASKMKIGILGSNGFIGSNLDLHLRNTKKFKVYCLSSFNKYKSRWVEKILHDIKKYKPDIIINCAADQNSKEDAKAIIDLLNSNLKANVLLSNEISKAFIGYNQLQCDTKLTRYRKVTTKTGVLYQLVLENTPFYAESGGQVGDTGTIAMGDHQIEVINTKKENDLIIHIVNELPASILTSVTATVDSNRRKEITAHHSLTHLLHAALRQVLGAHVAQKGSLVHEKGMRFDFSHFAKMTDEELEDVMKIVNQKIRENIPVVIKEMGKDEALALGAMALFGEKYGDEVSIYETVTVHFVGCHRTS